MKTSEELRNLLNRIDHKGYPAYKDTKGQYQFGTYVLSIDHVQGDPFASPSKVSVHIDGKQAGFDACLYDITFKRIALQDHLLRKIATNIREYSFKAKGSGKSGLISVTRPGQEILNRSACVIQPKNGDLVVRMEIGFPANGRTINARELEKILFDFLPVCIKKTMYQRSYRKEELEQVVDLANGAVLPRKSGVSMQPMKDAVSFVSPKSMEVTMELPHHGTIKGMGIKKGITLIVGGGYHGKSTLLKALESGVYNHIAGDGREYVITDDSAVKLRAEDGRSIQKADISMFIQNLPNGKNTTEFYTEDASGSTSQAANTVEAMEAGSTLFLIDEDTSATNFMIRDELMQRVVNREEEPIIPFIDRVSELYEREGISTILVAGSSGSYFHKADTVIQMKQYLPVEITDFAKKEAEQFPLVLEHIAEAKLPSFERIVKRDVAFQKENRIKMKALGKEAVSVNREEVDLRLVEQLTDHEQLEALVQILKYMKLHMFDGKRTLQEAVEELYTAMQKKELAAFCTVGIPGNLALPRKQEIYAVLNRCRGLLKIE